MVVSLLFLERSHFSYLVSQEISILLNGISTLPLENALSELKELLFAAADTPALVQF